MAGNSATTVYSSATVHPCCRGNYENVCSLHAVQACNYQKLA